MKNIESIDITSLTYSKDFFKKLQSKTQSAIIIVIGIFISIFLVWTFFGTCEDVVTADGNIRPKQNISSVHSLISGKVEQVNFVDGQTVQQGDVLFTLHCEDAQVSKQNIQDRIALLKTKLNDNRQMILSYHNEKNFLPETNVVPYTRIKVFSEIKNEMEKMTAIKQKNYETQKSLPQTVIAADTLEQTEIVWHQAQLDLSHYCENFLAGLIAEKESYEQQLENLEASLQQVETAINHATITAPINGTVLQLNEINAGDFIAGNQKLLSIIPSADDGYEVVLHVRERDIAKLRVGLHAKLKFGAFYKKKDYIGATVKNISADALSSGQSLFYLVTLTLDDCQADNKNDEIILKSGLQTTAKIITDKKNIFSYFMDKMEISL